MDNHTQTGETQDRDIRAAGTERGSMDTGMEKTDTDVKDSDMDTDTDTDTSTGMTDESDEEDTPGTGTGSAGGPTSGSQM